MTLAQLQYIVAIVDAGFNITLAAKRVHTTQPAISKQLKRLEDELGFHLFLRKGKSLNGLTRDGEAVLEHARAMVERARSINVLAANSRHDQDGELVILTTHTQARFVLPQAIAAFRRQHPQVSLHLRPHSDAQVHTLFADGRANLAIASSSGSAPLGGLAVPLYRWQRILLVPRDHKLAKLSHEVTFEDLAKEPLVGYESSLRPESSLSRAFFAQGVEPRFACTSSDADLIKTYARAGLGVGVLAEMAWREEEDDALHRIDISHLLPECTTWLVLRRGHVLRRYVFDFIEQFLPDLDRNQLQTALDGGNEPAWAMPPPWTAIKEKVALLP